jgi:hypothetical protein
VRLPRLRAGTGWWPGNDWPLALCAGGYERGPPGLTIARVTTWLNTPIQMQFRVIDRLTVRFAQSEDRDDHALF